MHVQRTFAEKPCLGTLNSSLWNKQLVLKASTAYWPLLAQFPTVWFRLIGPELTTVVKLISIL